jgi:hypothetical protein
MDHRSAYIRRSRKNSRLKRRVAAIGLLGVAACAGLYALAIGESAAPAVSAQAQAPADTAALAPTVLRAAAQVEARENTKKTRRVYPYSIVPGGLADRRELARAVVMDKVVAVHYAAFETDKATVKTVDKPRAVYVSYRKGNQVYWTSKKLQLAKGETLLSDGQNEIRTRCGNRISDVPQLPVEARGPSEEELDSSVEVAEDGAGEGTVAQVGFAVDTNPAGHGYQLQSFGTGAATPNANASNTRSAGMTGTFYSGLGPIWDGGTVSLAGQVSSDSSGTGTGTPNGGTPGTGTSGTGTSGTSGTGTPGKGTSGTGTPGTGTSGTGTPGTATSGPGAPGTVTPGTSTPGTNAPKPGGSNPGGPKNGSPTKGDSNTGGPHNAAPGTNGSDPGKGDTPAGGTSGGKTPDSGSPAGGTQPTTTPDGPVPPPADPGTKPSPLPDTLQPTDVPRQTNDPVKPPVKHANVPEPGTLWLAGAGVAALLATRRAKKRARD